MQTAAKKYALGQNGNLIVVVRLYIPNIFCSHLTSVYPNTCIGVLNAMPVATENVVFGRVGDPATRVVLPRTFTAGEQIAALLRFHAFVDNQELLNEGLNSQRITNAC